ncbi:DNA polymerase V [Enterococcus sp. PF1-24]|uniref:Y-family DNA polymerase n=1 Tax=unclassified Enterococcus TaxID=2608891 RepID=UPI0024740C7D|nr:MULTISPECIES: Y-family DNA polymerase [unclassified Enterococcus]MDH6364479.1 DNA polymerase V [Enterococcus sp. PFB1-1]MDH6401644.1 DNA polymerase V [Enterococcus sp. PF1-24]
MYESVLNFDYSKEPSRDILCIDCRSFYASVERGLHPLKAKLVVLSYPPDSESERGSGLILASSPAAKAAYDISNVSRARDLPFPYPEDLIIAEPRMKVYMQKNMEINNIYRRFCDENNFHVYSVDESFLDVTGALKLFDCSTPYQLARKIQQEVVEQLGIYVSIGIGDNPLLAKLALDNAAKHTDEMIAEWRYEDVPSTLWKIQNITDFWGISKRTAANLAKLNIHSIYDLAHSNYYAVKDRLGIIGAQLYAHSWGIDRSFLGEKIQPVSKSIGNSQVLNKDYIKRSEIEIVIKEMADQVATRLRRSGMQAQVVSLGIGYSLGYIDRYGNKGFRQQLKIHATNSSRELANALLLIFDKHYNRQEVRNISVNTGNLIHTDSLQLDLFSDPLQEERDMNVDHIVDTIRSKYGFKSIVRAVSLLDGGRAIARSSLIGGHAGGMAGIEGDSN